MYANEPVPLESIDAFVTPFVANLIWVPANPLLALTSPVLSILNKLSPAFVKLNEFPSIAPLALISPEAVIC